ncbi:hypothetical protein, partial [Pseudomonas syringae group genomosp. 3]|uniref:hypothetical protein n=2 Tax=Pseudomonas syringae group genomosp. 3 TaxID=251701 RepID=UPI000B261A0B
ILPNQETFFRVSLGAQSGLLSVESRELVSGRRMMELHVRTLGRDNLSELESVERLVTSIGPEAFEADVRRLSNLHEVDTASAIQSISRLTHPSLIGMSETPFQIFQRLCDDLVLRAPSLLQRPSYRYRNGDNTAVPFELWLSIVRHAREHFDPAGLDAEFLVAKMREGLSSKRAFDALIASKRPK